jgi:hypothetical protein
MVRLRHLICLLGLLVICLLGLLATPAVGQVQCGTVSNCPNASTPLAGTELLYIIQGGVSKKISAANFGSFLFGQIAADTLLGNPTGAPESPVGIPTGTGIMAALQLTPGTIGSLVLYNGILGTPTSVNLANATNLPLLAIIGLGTGVATFLANPSSANLLAMLTTSTGTGVNVFNNSPTFAGTVVEPDGGTYGSGGINGSNIGQTTPELGTFTSLTDTGLSTQGTPCNSAAGLFSTTRGRCPNAVPALTSSVVASPTSPSSTASFQMQGLAGSVTPGSTGNIVITISGTIVDAGATTVDIGVIYQLSYGTGAAPGNNTALAGTQIGTTQEFTLFVAATAAADVNIPFSITYPVTGLSLGTPYWIDLAAKAVTTASAAKFLNVMVVAVEQ